VGRADGPQFACAPDNVTLEFARPSRLAKPFETFWLIGHLIAAIRRRRPDVLFCPGSTYTVVAAFAHLLLADECPPIVAKLSNSLERGDLPFFARALYRLWLRDHQNFVQCAVGMAPPMRDEIRCHLKMPTDRIAIVPDPALDREGLVDLSVTARRDTCGRNYVAAGRLTSQKNFALLLRAFASVAGPQDRLLILGEGPQRKMLERLGKRLGISTRLEMPGHVQSIVDALTSAEVFVTSSNYEGLPAVIVQALAAGLPIVATDCSACMQYLLREGSLGKLVPIRDLRALAEAMQAAPRKRDLDVSSMRAVAEQFVVERSAELYLNVFRSVMARANPNRDPHVEPQLAKAL
jgi:glycosyltransferase involved in cell wall biosynthesis